MLDRTKPRHLEDDEAMGLMLWAGLQPFRGLKVSDFLIHIPNGGKRNPREAARLKRMGVRAGIPDFFLHVTKLEPETITPTGGLWIELKVPRELAGRHTHPTEAQTQQLLHMANCGYITAVCYGWLAAADLIRNYLGIHGNPQ